MSGPEIQELEPFQVWDKFAHFTAFACGAVPLALALRWTARWSHFSMKKSAIIAVAALSCFGALDEWHQLYTPKRSGADPQDWLADTLGATFGVGATLLTYGFIRRKNPASARGD